MVSFKKHKLVKASRRLQEQICSQHDKLLEVYCRTDQQCICVLCTMDDHRGHDTVSLKAERSEKQQKDLRNRYLSLFHYQRSAQTAVEDSEKIFTEMILSIERRRSEVRQMIRDQEKAAVSEAEERLKRLEQEITELKRRDADLEKLSFTEDHIHFLQVTDSVFLPKYNVYFFSVIYTTLMSFLSLSDSCQLTLDPNTAFKHLFLSERNTMVTRSTTVQPYPDHPDRFDVFPQVLCRESVSGRCYWEVGWRGDGGVGIAVSYKSISRKGYGGECRFGGDNDQSWRLFCYFSRYTFRYNNEATEISGVPVSSRVGVYVDHRAGTLSFYSISDTMTLIHRVQTTFTQPLYAGFWLNIDSSSWMRSDKNCRI
uniref:B30.2/SPRY domain-containing protein n=1 Tax=Astyanax mexicanus TaxID=7994 RepID=W5L963_ASTMX